MRLVIAEKPSLGRAIADAISETLHVNKDGKDPITVGQYKITWLYGHILSLKEPQDFNPDYKKWSLADLPIFFEDWDQKPNEATKDKLNQIGKLLKDAEQVIHAGDPDDEGQFLIDEVLRWFKYKGPIKRLQTADTTIGGLTKALKSMDDNSLHVADGYAAYARSIADLTVGVNMSRFFTLLNKGELLTVGRVQTPTLGLVVKRDELIEGHVKSKYYVVAGNMSIDGKNVPIIVNIPKDDVRLTDGHLLNIEDARAILEAINNKEFDNVEITKKTEFEQPPLPFNLTKLQTYCGNKFNYDPKKVMEITQDLREKYSAITYNRSDCQYLGEEHYQEAPDTVSTVCANIGFEPPGLDTTIKSKAFDDSKITAHFAIIPTDKKQNLASWSEEEKNVYLAICKYYLAQFLPPAKKHKTSLKRPVDEVGVISATSTEILEPGYRSIFKEIENEQLSDLSKIKEGMYKGLVNQCEIQEKETKPPARYTKTSLNEDMTRISKYVDDPEIKRLLLSKDEGKEGENGSIGTTATRPDIIEGLIKRGYLELEGKKLKSTELGREFYKVLPDELKKADMTAKWWVIQERIKTGESDYKELPKSVLQTCKDIMEEKHQTIDMSVLKSQHEEVGKCPRCGKPVIEGKQGYGCSGYKQGCKFVIWKKAKGGLLSKATLSKKNAIDLLNGNQVKISKLYSPSKDKTFSGFIKLNDKGSEYGAEYDLIFEKKKDTKRRTSGWKLGE